MPRTVSSITAFAAVLCAAEARAEIPHVDSITPGALRGVGWVPGDDWPIGYWEYLPSNFDEVPEGTLFPVLFSLGGIPSSNTDSTCPGGTPTCSFEDCGSTTVGTVGLCRALRRGATVPIAQGTWNDTDRPFLVFGPQNPVAPNSPTDYDADQLEALAQFVVDNYPADPRRLYMMGLSQGGRAVMQFPVAYPRRMAAVAASPGGSISPDDASCYFQDTALWALHGENDMDTNLGPGVFLPCPVVNFVRIYDNPDLLPESEACADRVGTPYPDGRITMYNDFAHNVWVPTIENVPLGQENTTQWSSSEACSFEADYTGYGADVEADGIYTWMLRFDRPQASAPADFEVEEDTESFELTATTLDDDPITYTWTQVGGDAVNIVSDGSATATVTGFEVGSEYTFEVFAVDSDSQWDVDQVTVTIVEGSAGSSSGSSTSSSTSTSGSSTSTSGGLSAGVTGEGETTSQPEATTSGEDGATSQAPASSTSGFPGTSSTATAPEGTSSAPDPSDGSETDADGTPDADDGSSQGCGCNSGERTWGWTLAMVLGLGLRRRRVAGPRP